MNLFDRMNDDLPDIRLVLGIGLVALLALAFLVGYFFV